MSHLAHGDLMSNPEIVATFLRLNAGHMIPKPPALSKFKFGPKLSRVSPAVSSYNERIIQTAP